MGMTALGKRQCEAEKRMHSVNHVIDGIIIDEHGSVTSFNPAPPEDIRLRRPGGHRELSSLTSDLLYLQRELAKKNAELERSTTEQNRAVAAL
jgi:hypothetical protein